MAKYPAWTPCFAEVFYRAKADGGQAGRFRRSLLKRRPEHCCGRFAPRAARHQYDQPRPLLKSGLIRRTSRWRNQSARWEEGHGNQTGYTQPP
jgi:hypothetical protein